MSETSAGTAQSRGRISGGVDHGGSDLKAKLAVGGLAVAWDLGPKRGSGANFIERRQLGANLIERAPTSMSHDNGCQDSPNMMPETGSELGRFILIERSGGHRRSSKLTFSGQTQIVPVPGPDLTADIGDLPCGEINGALRTPMLARAAGLFVGCPTHRWTPRAQRRALRPGHPDQLDRGLLLSLLLLRHIVQCRRHQTPTLPAGLPPGASGQKHRLADRPG